MKANSTFKTLFILFSFFYADKVYAACSTLSDSVDLGKYSSIAFAESGLATQQVKSGLNCAGLSIGLIGTTFLKYEVKNLPTHLVSINDPKEKINIYFNDFESKPILAGSNKEYASTTLLSLFTTSSGDLPFYAVIPEGQVVAPGIYKLTSDVRIDWYYAVPIVSVGCLLSTYDKSPGLEIERSALLGCQIAKWGSGVPSTLNYQIEILPDCRIATNDINFGSEAFASAFKPVQTSLGIRCSAKTAYKVSLSDGGNALNEQRRLRMSNTNNYLNYEIYKNISKQRWGSGTQQWSSNDASNNAAMYDGKTQQIYNFTSEILENNPENLPAGIYTDNVTVEVKF